ncbi:MAG: 16S rRNA (uracil(1498)-N(3))-methyltransferase [Steroidobacteraceae bacterium]
MRLTRVYLPHARDVGTRLALGSEAAVHLGRVLRLANGSDIEVFDGHGRAFAARLIMARAGEGEVELLAERPAIPESPLSLTLLQGLLRNEKMDWVIQKAVELGVQRIVAIATERSVVRLAAERSERRLRHWRTIAINACEQCGRSVLPQIELTSLAQLLAGALPAQRFVLQPRGAMTVDELDTALAQAAVMIGPEGGFSERESRTLADAEFRALRLGPRVMRTETAALAALTALQMRCGDLAGRSTERD